MNEVNINVRTMVSPSEILFCEADVNYTRIHYQDRIEIVAVPLKKIESQLKTFSFFRIHKSYLVNIRHLLHDITTHEVEMSNNRSLTISRRRVSDFRKKLKQNQY
jgi:DNA-binding LytR/AlgR family response regulator